VPGADRKYPQMLQHGELTYVRTYFYAA